MTSKIIIGLVAIVAIAIGVWHYFQVQTDNTLVEYRSPLMHIAFTHPQHYQPTERNDAFENNPVRIVNLVDTNLASTSFEASEGPPQIALLIVENPDDIDLETWIRGSSISNFQLSGDHVLASTTLGGQPALSYHFSGLYENDAVVTSYDGSVYIFTVGWMKSDDTLRKDFEKILPSVKFI